MQVRKYFTIGITAHGANDSTIPSTIYLDESQAGILDNIGLDIMMHPILPAHACWSRFAQCDVLVVAAKVPDCEEPHRHPSS
jgi:hypothetical protein